MNKAKITLQSLMDDAAAYYANLKNRQGTIGLQN